MTEKAETRRRIDWGAVLPILLLVVTTTIMIVPMVFGVSILGIEGREGVARALSGFADSPFAPLAVIALFIVLGLTGFPQFLMIGGTALIFGSLWGFAYSWVGTMVSATIGFWLGRASGGALVRRFGGPTVKRASELLGRRGIAASLIVRLIPSGPFIMVNMIAGASHMRLTQYLIGTGLGIIPKTALVALVGGHLAEFLRERDPVQLAIAGGLVLASVALGVWVRRRYLKPKDAAAPGSADAQPKAPAERQVS